jgi:uncharacterized protein
VAEQTRDEVDEVTEPAGPELADQDELDRLVDAWLTLEQTAQVLGIDVRRVRRLLRDRQLVAVRREPAPGAGVEQCVPSLLIADGQTLPELPGTVTLLTDAGYDDEEALRWLFTPDPTLPGSPIEAMRAGRKTEIRRRAQALAF